MSEYKKVAIDLRTSEEACLIDALVDIGFPRAAIEIHDKAVHLLGYGGDRRAQTAHVVIRRKHVGDMSNDLGFERMPDGTYRLHVSDYDKHSLAPGASRIGMRYDGGFVKRLSGLAALRTTEKTMLKKGYRLAQSVALSPTRKRMIWVK